MERQRNQLPPIYNERRNWEKPIPKPEPEPTIDVDLLSPEVRTPTNAENLPSVDQDCDAFFAPVAEGSEVLATDEHTPEPLTHVEVIEQQVDQTVSEVIDPLLGGIKHEFEVAVDVDGNCIIENLFNANPYYKLNDDVDICESGAIPLPLCYDPHVVRMEVKREDHLSGAIPFNENVIFSYKIKIFQKKTIFIIFNTYRKTATVCIKCEWAIIRTKSLCVVKL